MHPLLVVVKSVPIQECTLPIKTTKQLEELYDYIYDIGDKLIKTYDPCKGGTVCDYKYCCAGCKYLDTMGCTTKCMTCKFWLCGKARQNIEPLIEEELDELINLYRYIGFSGMRESRKEVFDNCVESKYGRIRLNYLKSKYGGIKFVNWCE